MRLVVQYLLVSGVPKERYERTPLTPLNNGLNRLFENFLAILKNVERWRLRRRKT